MQEGLVLNQPFAVGCQKRLYHPGVELCAGAPLDLPHGGRVGHRLAIGTIGDHGIAVLAARGELAFETTVESDLAPLNFLVDKMFEVSRAIHVMRDPTRGGLATSLNEIACQSEVVIRLDETSIPVRPAVVAACEMLGFDPLYIANEGKLVALVSAEVSDEVLEAMRSTPYGEEACRIGVVEESPPGRVLMRTAIGGMRVVDILSGEMLPRIC